MPIDAVNPDLMQLKRNRPGNHEPRFAVDVQFQRDDMLVIEVVEHDLLPIVLELPILIVQRTLNFVAANVDVLLDSNDCGGKKELI
jgi:hypothetical protein